MRKEGREKAPQHRVDTAGSKALVAMDCSCTRALAGALPDSQLPGRCRARVGRGGCQKGTPLLMAPALDAPLRRTRQKVAKLVKRWLQSATRSNSAQIPASSAKSGKHRPNKGNIGLNLVEFGRFWPQSVQNSAQIWSKSSNQDEFDRICWSSAKPGQLGTTLVGFGPNLLKSIPNSGNIPQRARRYENSIWRKPPPLSLATARFFVIAFSF